MSQVIVSDTFDDVENDKHFLYLIKRYLTTPRHIIFKIYVKGWRFDCFVKFFVSLGLVE